MSLPTDFQDDILNESVNPKRKYQMIYNDDGTVSFEDVTSYSQTGSEFGAKEVNETNENVNQNTEDIGDKGSLTTVNKNNLVEAVNELNELISKFIVSELENVTFKYNNEDNLNRFEIVYALKSGAIVLLWWNGDEIAYDFYDGKTWYAIWRFGYSIILDDLSSVISNTTSKKIAGALALKELYQTTQEDISIGSDVSITSSGLHYARKSGKSVMVNVIIKNKYQWDSGRELYIGSIPTNYRPSSDIGFIGISKNKVTYGCSCYQDGRILLWSNEMLQANDEFSICLSWVI